MIDEELVKELGSSSFPQEKNAQHSRQVSNSSDMRSGLDNSYQESYHYQNTGTI
jgi:hypothetical protein